MNIQSVSIKNAALLFSCVFVLSVFISTVLVPRFYRLADLNQRLESVEKRIKEQKIKSLDDNALVAPENRKEGLTDNWEMNAGLAIGAFEDILPSLRKIAHVHRFRLINVMPDLSLPLKDMPFIKIYVVIEGDFLLFRNFLIALLKLQCLDHIESISVRTANQTKTIQLALWLARS